MCTSVEYPDIADDLRRLVGRDNGRLEDDTTGGARADWDLLRLVEVDARCSCGELRLDGWLSGALVHVRGHTRSSLPHTFDFVMVNTEPPTLQTWICRVDEFPGATLPKSINVLDGGKKPPSPLLTEYTTIGAVDAEPESSVSAEPPVVQTKK